MKILVHEWVTGGGLSDGDVPASWVVEGRAMRRAIAADFHALGGVEVVMTLDHRLAAECNPWSTVLVGPGEEPETFSRLATVADYTALIAPETGGVLEARTLQIEQAGGQSLGSNREAIALTADKRRFAAHLADVGIPTPRIATFRPGEELPSDFPFPAVIKPIDGAGSVHTFLIAGLEENVPSVDLPAEMLIQPFCAGDALSASFLVSSSGDVRLVGVGRQRVSIRAGVFEYRGGTVPLPAHLALGAPRAAVESVCGLRGWVGVDFIREPRSGACTVIEINPRPTTSLVGFCRLLPPGTIAQAWLNTVRGSHPERHLSPLVGDEIRDVVQFRPDGTWIVDAEDIDDDRA